MSLGRRFERLLFSVMGPASVGDVGAPAREVPPPAPQACGTCGKDLAEHEVVRDARLTYLRCPG